MTFFPLNNDRSLFITLALTGGGLAAYYYFMRTVANPDSKQRPLENIPVPKGGVPYFGHLFALTSSPSSQIAKWQKELGLIMCVNMGVKPWIFLSDPDLAHDLFCKNGSATSNRPFQTFTHHYHSKNRGIAFNNPSSQWNKTRAAVSQYISSKTVSGLSHVLELEADALVQRLLDTSAKDGQVDIVEPLQLAAMNGILTIGFGKRASSINDPLFQAVMGNLNEAIRHANMVRDMRVFLPAFSLFDYLFRPGMHGFVEKDTNPLYRRLIKEGLESNADCLVKRLSQLDYLDEKALIVTMNDVIAGGSDTVAITAAWAMVILCRHQETQRAVRKEVDEFIAMHKRIPTFADRDQLPLLVSVQKECMRYRVTSAFGRIVSMNLLVVAVIVAVLVFLIKHLRCHLLTVTCRGYFIPKGTTLVSNMRAIHMNPDVYDDPEKFIPDRFINRSKPMYACANMNVQERDHFVFGWGRRTCPGVYMAEVEIYNILVRLLAKSIIAPPFSPDGKLIYPDLDKLDDVGVVILPKDRILRIIARSDTLI
ncbi:cytochrome P450 [Zychaea mexicana]|uniref:cytochrome P450 n=1 Tax=Zychaea mexicana TaxID=64656 RepID=UPI0022FE8131|nr:cytochrome P450 [Zychaea mexicana]KAI9490810.1 cytochrome P450 [Zychaea mexicana]